MSDTYRLIDDKVNAVKKKYDDEQKGTGYAAATGYLSSALRCVLTEIKIYHGEDAYKAALKSAGLA